MQHAAAHIKHPDYVHITELFFNELKQAEAGKRGALLYMKTYIPTTPLIKQGLIQTITIGGTYYEFAVIKLDNSGKKEIVSQEKGKLLPLHGGEDLAALLDTHLMTRVDAITANIGFPLSYDKGEKGQPDGTFIKATKEHKFLGLLGHKVGEFILDRYIRKYNAYTMVAVANDVVCITQADAGLVLGTGCNMGIRSEDTKGTFVANLESGNSHAYESTSELEMIDQHSTNPGANTFEKLVSGHYLPLHFNALARKIGLNKQISVSEELSELASEDTGLAGEIARELFARSAKYTAAHLAGIYKFRGNPKTFTVSAEGSLYHYGFKYKKTMEHHLLSQNIPVHFKSQPNSGVFSPLSLLGV